jgi:hypothetical protein
VGQDGCYGITGKHGDGADYNINGLGYAGLSFGLYRENTRMKENDIKFRMIRQSIPETARWADTTYHRNPKGIEHVVKKLEAQQRNSM